LLLPTTETGYRIIKIGKRRMGKTEKGGGEDKKRDKG
jgi:hypothetical protein